MPYAGTALLWLLRGAGQAPGHQIFGMRLDFLHLPGWLVRVLYLLSEEAVKLADPSVPSTMLLQVDLISIYLFI